MRQIVDDREDGVVALNVKLRLELALGQRKALTLLTPALASSENRYVPHDAHRVLCVVLPIIEMGPPLATSAIDAG